MQSATSKAYLKEFWQKLPPSSMALLVLAIFFSFAPIGFANDISVNGRFPISRLLIAVITSGLLSAGVAYGAMRNQWWVLIFSLVAFIGGMFISIQIPLLPESDENQVRVTMDAFAMIACMTLGYGLFISFIGRIGIGKRELDVEIELAREIHQQLVPDIHFTSDQLEIVGKSSPATQVGGDLIDLTEIEDRQVAYIADVSGHGVGAALMMAMFKSALRTQLRQSTDLESALKPVSDTIYRLKKRTMFLTFAGFEHLPDHRIRYTTAGHLPILHYAAKEKICNQLLVRQLPLSVTADVSIQFQETVVEPGDILILITDGLTETENASREEFGIERIEKMIQQLHQQPLTSILDSIMKSVNTFGNTFDDRSILLARFR